MRARVLVSFLALASLAAGHSGLAADRDGSPAVLVELFTSQGCSSCPPADRLLAKLAREGRIDGIEVIPLAFHVDYWYYIGWQDPFSSEAWSNRQRAYATAMGLDTIYTPQVFLNGNRQIVGADERQVRRQIRQVAVGRPAIDLELQVIEITADGALRVEVAASVPSGALGNRTLGLLALFQDKLVTPVSRGENARRTLENERVVRELRAVLEFPAAKAATAREIVELSLAPEWPVEDLGLVLFLQDPHSMEVLGATVMRLDRRDVEVVANRDSR